MSLSNLEEMRQRDDFIALSSFLRRGNRDGCAELFLVFSDRIHGNGLKLYQRMLRLDISKHFSTERVIKHWNRLPKEMVGAPSLSVLSSYLKNSFNNRL